MKPDQLRVHSLLKDTVTLLCKNGLNFHSVLRIEGVIGITVDDGDVFLVHINDVFGNSVDSAGDEQLMLPRSPQRTVDNVEVCKKPIKGQFRSSSAEHRTYVQRQTEEDIVDSAQPPDNSSLFVVPHSSKTDESSYFNHPSADDTAAASNNSDSFFEFSQAKIEPKHEEGGDDDVVFLSPEDLPLDGFGQGRYLEQTQTKSNSRKWKDDVSAARNRELRKQNTGVRRVVTSRKNSPLHLQKYEQNALTSFSSQIGHQQTMFRPSSSYMSEGGEVSSYLDDSYSVHGGAVDSNNSTGDVGVDLMMVDNSQQSFFGDSNDNDNASQGNQNFAASSSEVEQKSCKRIASDQSQQKRKPGRPSQQVTRDCWATVTATKFLCRMCGSSFNHRPSLLAHQINKHGRPKNRRGRPPTQPFTQ